MKDYTITEAKEIVRKVLDKCGVRRNDNDLSCKVGKCTYNCFLYDKGKCKKSIGYLTNELLEKAEEFLNQVDWSRIPIDTKVLVRDRETNDWNKRYFAGYENGQVITFLNGATYWSREGTDIEVWNYARLYKEGEYV